MYFASGQGFFAPLELSGHVNANPFANANVKQAATEGLIATGHALGDAATDITVLQLALTRLGQATGRPDVNPGPPNGTMNGQTAQATAQAINVLSAAGINALPAVEMASVQAALLVGTSNATAQNAIANHAIELAAAFNVAADHFVANPSTIPQIVVPRPWYTTPLGIGAIIVGGIIAWKVLT